MYILTYNMYILKNKEKKGRAWEIKFDKIALGDL